MEREVVAPAGAEVPMVEQAVVQRMRVLREVGWGAKRIARELGLARNTVRRYLREGGLPRHFRPPCAARLQHARGRERMHDGRLPRCLPRRAQADGQELRHGRGLPHDRSARPERSHDPGFLGVY